MGPELDYEIEHTSDDVTVLRRSAEGARISRGEKKIKETSSVKHNTSRY